MGLTRYIHTIINPLIKPLQIDFIYRLGDIIYEPYAPYSYVQGHISLSFYATVNNLLKTNDSIVDLPSQVYGGASW